MAIAVITVWTHTSAQISTDTKDVQVAKQKLQIGTNSSKYFSSILETISGAATHNQSPTAKAVYDYIQSLGHLTTVAHDSSLQLFGTTANPLGVKGYGAASNGQVPSKATGGITWITPLTAEVDGSVTNEGSMTVGVGGANTSTIVSNTSGSTAVTVSGSNTVLVTESGSTITVQADTSLLATVNDINAARNRDDSTWVKYSGSYVGKRIGDNVYRYGTTSLRSTDTSGILNVYNNSTTKQGVYFRYNDASTNGFNFFQLDPDNQTNNSSLGNFNFWATNFDGANTPYSTRANHVWRFGYNVNQSGARVLSTDADLHIAFESNFYNVYATGRRKRSWEWHLQSQDTLGNVHRVISAIGAHDGKDGEITLNVNRFTLNPYGVSDVYFDMDHVAKYTYIDSMRFLFNVPQVGYPFFSFRNAGNTAYLKMFQADASDRLVLNADGNDLYTYAPTFTFNTLATITTNDGNPIQIGNSAAKSFPSIFAPGSEVLRLRSNTGGANTWSTYVNSDNIEYRTSAGGAYMYFYAGSAYILGANDRIGIGTSPGARFHIRQNGNAGGNGLQMTNSDASFSTYQAVNASGDHIWYHNAGSQRMILTQAGSLGLMTSGTPARTLQVTGEARITDLTTDAPTQIVGADADGDLGAITVGSGLNLTAGTLTATAGGLSGTGAANQVTYWSGTNTIAGSSNLTWDGTSHTVTGKGVYAVGGSFGSTSVGVDMSGNMTSTANSVNLYSLRNSITFTNDGTKTGNNFRGIYVPTTTSGSTAGSHNAVFLEPTNSSPNVSSLYGLFGVVTEASASGNLGSRYGAFLSVDKSSNDNTTHTGVGVKGRVRDQSTSGRWSTAYGLESEVTDAQNATGVYIGTLNSRSTANNITGVRIGSTVSGSGVVADEVKGVSLTFSETSSGSVTTYYGLYCAATAAATTNYLLYNSTDFRNYLNGSLALGVDDTGAKLFVRGTGTTSSTYEIITEKSDGTDVFLVRDDGMSAFGTTPVSTERLTVRGSTSDNTAKALVAERSSGTDLFGVQNDGKVSINNAAYTEELTINGQAQLDGAILTSQTGSVTASGHVIYNNGSGGTYSGYLTVGDGTRQLAIMPTMIERHVIDYAVDWTTGRKGAFWTVPARFDGWKIAKAYIEVTSVGAGAGDDEITIEIGGVGEGVQIVTAGTHTLVMDDVINTDDVITFNVTTISATPAKGLNVSLELSKN